MKISEEWFIVQSPMATICVGLHVPAASEVIGTVHITTDLAVSTLNCAPVA